MKKFIALALTVISLQAADEVTESSRLLENGSKELTITYPLLAQGLVRIRAHSSLHNVSRIKIRRHALNSVIVKTKVEAIDKGMTVLADDTLNNKVRRGNRLQIQLFNRLSNKGNYYTVYVPHDADVEATMAPDSSRGFISYNSSAPTKLQVLGRIVTVDRVRYETAYVFEKIDCGNETSPITKLENQNGEIKAYTGRYKDMPIESERDLQ